MKEIIILGAGISGLSAAWFLKKKAKITILEKSFRVGGWIQTQHKDGFLFEDGPRGFLSNKKGKVTLQLAHDLGLKSELIKANSQARTRYLYHRAKLQPLNLFFLLKMNMIKLCLREWNLKGHSDVDESIGSFFTRRFDKKFATILVDPLVKGIYGGDLFQLSMQTCFPLLVQWEKEYGSLTKAFFMIPKEPQMLYSFFNGMETLPLSIAQNIDADIHFNTLAKKISFSDKKVKVHCVDKSYEADHLIAAIGLNDLKSLLSQQHLPFLPTLSLTTVNLGFSKPLLKKRGFGYLVSSTEQESILGMTWDSQIFPRNPLTTTICVMISGEPLYPEQMARDVLYRHLHIKDIPDAVHIHTARDAIPQYPVGYSAQLKKFSHPRLTLLGNSYHGPGLNDCIYAASILKICS